MGKGQIDTVTLCIGDYPLCLNLLKTCLFRSEENIYYLLNLFHILFFPSNLCSWFNTLFDIAYFLMFCNGFPILINLWGLLEICRPVVGAILNSCHWRWESPNGGGAMEEGSCKTLRGPSSNILIWWGSCFPMSTCKHIRGHCGTHCGITVQNAHHVAIAEDKQVWDWSASELEDYWES